MRSPASTAVPVAVVQDRCFERHLEGIFHLETPKRSTAFEELVRHPVLAGSLRAVAPRLATVEELAWVHTAAHIESVARTAGKGLSTFDLDTQATAASYDTARLAVGGVFSLLDAIVDGKARRGFAFVRPPGHHAEPGRAMGFCLFNNAALGAAYLKAHHGLGRVMIVDIDAHHGNGIQSAFYRSSAVLYFSMHRFPGFPGTGKVGEVGRAEGEGFTANVPLDRGHGDRTFARVLHHIARPLAEAFRPEMILVPCGFDLYLHDRLGGMRATPAGYALLARLLVQMAESVCRGRIAFIAEGGYSLKGIRACGFSLLQALCDGCAPSEQILAKLDRARPSRFSMLRKAMDVQRKYWPNLG